MAGTTDKDLHVSYEDQQKINKFARQNAKLDDILEELKSKENEMQALEDAESDLLLSIEKDQIPIGDVFLFLSVDDTQEKIEEKKEFVEKEIKELKNQQEAVKQVMSDLKVQLYAKFGTNINLEPE